MTEQLGRPRRVVILGALSTIAESLVRRLAAQGAHLALAARRADRLDALRADALGRGAASAEIFALDLAADLDVAAELDRMLAALGGEADAVVVIYGALGDQKIAERDLAAHDRLLAVNFTSAARWCAAAANRLEAQKHGVLLAVSSVAGDRGRQSNYVYGAAKAGLTTLVEGIAHRLAPSGARAVAAKLGFVDTAMTAHLPRGGPLWAKPDAVAQSLARLIDAPSKPVVYLPWFWRPILAIVRNVPAPIFHKTRL